MKRTLKIFVAIMLVICAITALSVTAFAEESNEEAAWTLAKDFVKDEYKEVINHLPESDTIKKVTNFAESEDEAMFAYYVDELDGLEYCIMYRAVKISEYETIIFQTTEYIVNTDGSMTLNYVTNKPWNYEDLIDQLS